MCIYLSAVALFLLAACGSGGGNGHTNAGDNNVTVDPLAPTAGISLSPRAVVGGGSTTATITFSEDVTGLLIGDLVIQGGVAGSFTPVDARTYTLAIVAAGSGSTTVDVDLPSGVCTSSTGHLNATARGQAAIAYAPWASAMGSDSYGVWADLTVDGGVHGTATQRLRLIAPGTFSMGQSTDPGGLLVYEAQHDVTFTLPYWAADTECTQAMYMAVTGTNPSHFTAGGLTLPVENVTWFASRQFVIDLNRKFTNFYAMLPTESQWEYMARAGTSTPFSLETVTTETVNCMVDPTDPYVSTGSDHGSTVTVTSLPANPWGLYGVHGNVWEWCADYWLFTWGDIPRVDPKWETFNSNNVLRGGSYLQPAARARSASRVAVWPSDYGPNAGFRFIVAAQPVGSG